MEARRSPPRRSPAWSTAGLVCLLACAGPTGSTPPPPTTPAPAAISATSKPLAQLTTSAPPTGRSPGCGRSSGWPSGATSITVNGKARALLVRLPPGYDGSRAQPILFAFHGAGGTGPAFEPEFALGAAWRARGVVVYPTALTVTADGPTTWRRDSDDDLAFLDAMIDQLGDGLCLDRARVFVAGFSSGGYFANTVGCRRGDRIRAIVTAAGGDRDFNDQCRGNLAVQIVIGAQDGVVPYGGAPGVTNLDHAHLARDHFVAANGCQPQTKPIDPAPCVEYQGCKANAPVVYCEFPGGHVWPPYLADAGLEFLKRF